MLLNLAEKACRGLTEVDAILCAEGSADGFEADPEAGAFVAQYRSPAAGAVQFAGGRAADSVGPRTRDDENSGASSETRVERNVHVAAEVEIAGDLGGDCLARPGLNGRIGDAGDSDAGARDVVEGDPRRSSCVFKHRLEARGGFMIGDTHELDGTCRSAAKDAGRVGDDATGFSAAGIDSKVEGHGSHHMRKA